jgi:hypothetical protein
MAPTRFLTTALVAIFCVSAVAQVALTKDANAAVRKDVSENAGKNCNTPPKGSGVIVGMFVGRAEAKFFPSDSSVSLSRYKCFTTMSECQGWLYTMNTLYSVNGPTPVARCFIR